MEPETIQPKIKNGFISHLLLLSPLNWVLEYHKNEFNSLNVWAKLCYKETKFPTALCPVSWQYSTAKIPAILLPCTDLSAT